METKTKVLILEACRRSFRAGTSAIGSLVVTMLLLLGAGCAPVASATATHDRTRYIHCNVHLPSACFGIRQGDRVVLTIPVDFMRYDIELGGGVRALVYAGYHPGIVDATMASQFDACVRTSEVCRFVSRGDGDIEAVYSGAREDFIVHVMIGGVDDSNEANALEFLENFRPCSREGQSATCRDTPAFPAPPRR